ncbi:hypothetical protein L226DRAFT_550071 [Lentinus tigrinus ALCF2SS1-7]|nr:hypothetical protein L226DRAFT_550071 [Lentinus tigrinus ALCF2SS1-7]
MEETLQAYPHAAGQLLRDGDQWEISLTASSIMVEVEDSGTASLGLDQHPWVVQRNLSRFFRSRVYEPSRYPSDPALIHSQPSSDSVHSLLLIKLTITQEETAIGVSWHHTLGDATVLLRFMQLLSQRYQRDDRPAPALPTPSFTKRFFRSPDDALLEAYSPLMPHLAHACPTADLGQRYAAMNRDTAEVAFNVTTTQLRNLRDLIMKRKALDVRPSSQDCLTAYIVSVINRHSEIPITKITNAASYRAVPGAVESPAVAGNAIYIIPCDLSPGSTLEDSACSIRRSIIRSREPSFVEEYMSVASHLMLSAANAGRSMFFAAPPGHASVNSNVAISWHTAHFGFPTRIRFHTSGINDRYIRVFFSNPDPDYIRRTVEGELAAQIPTVDRPEGSLDVFFAVESRIRDVVHRNITTDLDSPMFPENVIA